MGPSLDPDVRRAVLRRFLEEDVGRGDITTLAVVSADRRAVGQFVAKEPLVVAGVELAIDVLRLLDEKADADVLHRDGEFLAERGPLATVRGAARALLTGERVATNLLQRLSGIATLTKRFVEAVRGTQARILDTRKTTPGLRAFEKYAVALGGGLNHRHALDDAILIKDNHVRMAGGVRAAIEGAQRGRAQARWFEVEVTDLKELREALEYDVEAILLDNMTPGMVREAVQIVRAGRGKGPVVVEASGGITMDNVREFAEAGVDWISVGALTHSARAVDISFEIEPA
jgi:nicotinate-nucleotide pyrophosphorylase (carboxylating)